MAITIIRKVLKFRKLLLRKRGHCTFSLKEDEGEQYLSIHSQRYFDFSLL